MRTRIFFRSGCASDPRRRLGRKKMREDAGRCHRRDAVPRPPKRRTERKMMTTELESASLDLHAGAPAGKIAMHVTKPSGDERSGEHTSEPQSLTRNLYAAF